MQTYRAKSIFVSKTFWLNIVAILVAMLETQDVTNLIPAAIQQYMVSAIALLNIILRVWTVRPVAVMPPGEVRGVQVESI